MPGMTMPMPGEASGQEEARGQEAAVKSARAAKRKAATGHTPATEAHDHAWDSIDRMPACTMPMRAMRHNADAWASMPAMRWR